MSAHGVHWRVQSYETRREEQSKGEEKERKEVKRRGLVVVVVVVVLKGGRGGGRGRGRTVPSANNGGEGTAALLTRLGNTTPAGDDLKQTRPPLRQQERADARSNFVWGDARLGQPVLDTVRGGHQDRAQDAPFS
jgi:hypothetical protein